MNKYLVTFEFESTKGTIEFESRNKCQSVYNIKDVVTKFCDGKNIYTERNKIIILFFCKLN